MHSEIVEWFNVLVHQVNDNRVLSTALLLVGEGVAYSVDDSTKNLFQANWLSPHYKHHFSFILKLVTGSPARGIQFSDLLNEDDESHEQTKQGALNSEYNVLTLADVLQHIWGKKAPC